MKTRGTLNLIIGNMFAGKTTELINRIDIMRKHGRKSVLVLKPSTDTRSGTTRLKNFHGAVTPAIEVAADNAQSILDAVYQSYTIEDSPRSTSRKPDIVAIDEIQFFSLKSGIYQVIDRLLELGYDVICAGLRLDFKGEPFGSTLALIGLCGGMHNVTLLYSYCAKCGKPAHLPQRLIDGKPAPHDSKQVLVGGKESYEARCYECHELPGKPTLGFSSFLDDDGSH